MHIILLTHVFSCYQKLQNILREQNAANAIMYCFGAAVAEAKRMGNVKAGVLEKPVVTRAVQLVKGMMDFVVFQLNTLDLSNKKDDIKNIVWVEHGKDLDFLMNASF